MVELKNDKGKRQFSCYISDDIYVSILNAYYNREREPKSNRFLCYYHFLKKEYVKSAVELLLWKNIDPILAHDYVCKVGEEGAKKYELDSWKKVDPYRYQQAFFRHFHKKGKNRSDFGLPHWAHCLWNLIQLEWFRRQNEDRHLKQKTS